MFGDTNNVKSKRNLIILVIVICFFLLVIGGYFVNKNSLKNSYQQHLEIIGDSDIIMYQDSKYIEYGYQAYDSNGVDLTEQVIINNQVNTSIIGEYQVSYQLGNIIKYRNITVISKNNKVTYLILKGDNIVYLHLGDKYQELGYEILDTTEHISKDRVKVIGNVDSEKTGVYKIIYSFTKDDGITISAERTVIVTDINMFIEYDDSKITNKDVVINVMVDDNYFDYLILPDNTKVTDREINFSANNNGSYKFIVYNKNGKFKEEVVKINNIDKIKPKVTCQAKSFMNETAVNVNASDNNKISKYIYNNEYSSITNKYTIPKKLSTLKVAVYDEAGNVTNVSCNISEGLIEMHFIPGVSDDDAILIRTEDKTIMIDGGQWEAKDVIVNYLKTLGVTKIDALIGSHVHWNHVQSHAAILDNFLVDKIYYPVDIFNCASLQQCSSKDVKYMKDKIIEKNKTPIILKAKDKVIIGDMEIYVLYPEKVTTAQNINSLVFILKYGDNKFMFTGDIPSKYINTNDFLTNANYFGMNLDIDVYKWSHHGYGDTHLSNEFMAAISPKYAIIPRYFCNSIWPNNERTKYQINNYGINVYEVCKGKNIVLVSDGKTIDIKTNQAPENYRK